MNNYDVCPCASLGCGGAKNPEQFYKTCSRGYEDCEKYQDDRLDVEVPGICNSREIHDINGYNGDEEIIVFAGGIL